MRFGFLQRLIIGLCIVLMFGRIVYRHANLLHEDIAEAAVKSERKDSITGPDLPRTDAVQEMTLLRGPGGKYIKVRFASEGRCMMGDLDLMQLDVEHSDNQTFLMTLEPISGDGNAQPVQSVPVSIGQIATGGEVLLEIPDFVVPVPLGLYICRDGSHTGSCADKEAVPFEQMLNDLIAIQERPDELKKFSERDRVYFFSYVVLDEAKARTINADSSEEKGALQFATAAARLRGAVGDWEVTEVRAQGIGSALRSQPLKFENGVAVLNLPAARPELCDESMRSEE